MLKKIFNLLFSFGLIIALSFSFLNIDLGHGEHCDKSSHAEKTEAFFSVGLDCIYACSHNAHLLPNLSCQCEKYPTLIEPLHFNEKSENKNCSFYTYIYVSTFNPLFSSFKYFKNKSPPSS